MVLVLCLGYNLIELFVVCWLGMGNFGICVFELGCW